MRKRLPFPPLAPTKCRSAEKSAHFSFSVVLHFISFLTPPKTKRKRRSGKKIIQSGCITLLTVISDYSPRLLLLYKEEFPKGIHTKHTHYHGTSSLSLSHLRGFFSIFFSLLENHLRYGKK